MKCLRVLFSMLLATAAFADEPNQLTDTEKVAGWKLLFDGKTTDGWVSISTDAFPEKGWVVEDGALKHLAKGGGGDIVTKEVFENFELKWEWKIGEAGNSGVKYNLPNAKRNVGCEYQMLDDEKHPDGKIKGRLHQSAALYDLIEPSDETKPKPVGEWNESLLVVDGNKVEHWLNGTKAVSYELGSEEFIALVKKSKYRGASAFGIKKAGPILLQDHGDEVAVRSIKLRVIKK